MTLTGTCEVYVKLNNTPTNTVSIKISTESFDMVVLNLRTQEIVSVFGDKLENSIFIISLIYNKIRICTIFRIESGAV